MSNLALDNRMTENEKWLLTGATGQLGTHVTSMLAHDVHVDEVICLGRRPSSVAGVSFIKQDLQLLPALQRTVSGISPTHILHMGGITSTQEALGNPSYTQTINVSATSTIASAAAAVGARLLFTSTDMVFDGTRAPYRENDPPQPVSVYGESKVRAEQAILQFSNTLIARLPLMYGLSASNSPTAFQRQLEALLQGKQLNLFIDEYRTPLWFEDAASALIALARSDLCGTIHVAGPERLSRFDLIAQAAAMLKLDMSLLARCSRLSVSSPEPRQEDLSLDGTKFLELFPDSHPGPLRPDVLRQFDK